MFLLLSQRYSMDVVTCSIVLGSISGNIYVFLYMFNKCMCSFVFNVSQPCRQINIHIYRSLLLS